MFHTIMGRAEPISAGMTIVAGLAITSSFASNVPPDLFRSSGIELDFSSQSCLLLYIHRTMACQYLVFTLDDQSYALPLPSVDRVARVAQITPLPNAPGIVLGVINIHGRIIPVIDFRRRFNLPKREIVLDDQLILAHAGLRRLALIADAVTEVIECPDHGLALTEHIVPGTKYLEGILKFKDGLVLIHDLDKFLSLEEEKALDIALETA
jgi:purine-binding chemotaxis protein CheW